MAINFDALPKEKQSGNKVIPGMYKFEIVKAEMREDNYNGGPDFLGLNLKLSTLDGKMAGFLNDKIVENPKPAVAYKIQRLIRAVDLDISGSVELADLAKLLVGAKGFVDVTEFTPEGGSPITIVNLFEHDCYYTKKERTIVEEIANGGSPKTIEDIVDEEDDEY